MSIIISRKDSIRHLINPLHIYCRLIDIGVKRSFAKQIVRIYDYLYTLFTK